MGRFPQTSRGAALGPLIPLSLSLNLSPMCWTYPIQNKSWGSWAAAHVFIRPIGSAYIDIYTVMYLWTGVECEGKKIKAISSLPLQFNKSAIFEYLSLVYFQEFSLAIALFLVVIQIKIFVSIAPYIQISQSTWQAFIKIWLTFPHD